MTERPVIRRFSEESLLVEWPGDPAAMQRVRALDVMLRDHQAHGVLECVPGARSLLILFDRDRVDADRLTTRVEQWSRLTTRQTVTVNHHVVPVCYGASFGPDLPDIAARCGLTVDEVVRRHHGSTYSVRNIGFLPGFPYLDGLDPSLWLPRRTEPRIHVPAGSVAIAAGQTGIYPSRSPGGWHLIGRTPLTLFDPEAIPPARFEPGDTVTFDPIGEKAFERMLAEARPAR